MKDIFKKIIKEFHEKGIPRVYSRSYELPLNSGKVISVIGPRRSGKTFLFYDLISKLDDITKAVYINFEDERFNIKSTDLQYIYDAYLELYPENDEIYFFFDEIQEIVGWEKFVRRSYDTISKNIFITGSSAKLLSKEIATSLRGRTITFEVLPLSFKEYLSFKEIPLEYITSKEKAKIISSFFDYFELGGYPELLFADPHFHKQIIKDYVDVMLLRDVIERYGLQNTVSIDVLMKRCISSFAKELSVNKLFNELKSLGVKISKENVYQYLAYFSEAYLVLPLELYSNKVSKKELRKIYLPDHSFCKLQKYFISENKGRILENIVFLQLMRLNLDSFYFKSKGECDFIIRAGLKIVNAIQVCYKLDVQNKPREVSGLIEALTHHSLTEGLILTYDQEDEFVVDGKKIKVIPVWKWLLS